MTVEIKVPSFGESITEVFIGKWLKKLGDVVRVDEPLVEIESDKATQELPAPAAGKLSQIIKHNGETAAIAEVIAYIEPVGAGAAPASPPRRETPPAKPAPEVKKEKKKDEPQPVAEKPVAARTAAPPPKPAPAPAAPQPVAPEPIDAPPAIPTTTSYADPEQDGLRIMPAARRLLDAAGLTADQIQASGPGGRLLKEDVERHIAAQRREHVAAVEQSSTDKTSDRSEKVSPMSPMRRTIAQRLVQAQQTAALLTTFNEVDMSAVMDLRARYKEIFQERHGLKLGFMGFFIRAVIDALKAFPQINAEVRGTDVVYHNYYDIGVAIGAGGKGLVVPVIRNADKLSIAAIESAIADYGKKVKENKIDIEDLKGGTFTISNGGVYGSLLSTPIVNPPQSGILGMHAIQDRPVAVKGQVVIRPMMYIALTYDHRLVDGREAVTFLKRIKECVEDPARLLMEI